VKKFSLSITLQYGLSHPVISAFVRPVQQNECWAFDTNVVLGGHTALVFRAILFARCSTQFIGPEEEAEAGPSVQNVNSSSRFPIGRHDFWAVFALESIFPEQQYG
jgi:hypothetical protein